MIKVVEHNDIDELVELIVKYNKASKKVRYLDNDKLKLETHIKQILQRKDYKVLINIHNDKIDSYTELNVVLEDKYLQITTFLSFADFNQSLNCFFAYIKEKYSGFELHYVVGDFNKEAIAYMKQLSNATSNGLEIMLHIKKEWLTNADYNNCTALRTADYKQFISIHDKTFPNVYWDGDKLVNLKIFNIYVNKDNNTINSYAVVSNYGKSEEEIYFHYPFTIKEETLAPIHSAVNSALKTAESVQILLEGANEGTEITLKKMGFKQKERIITWHIESI